MFTNAMKPIRRKSDVEGARLDVVKLLAVNFLKRMKGDGQRAALASFSAVFLRVTSLTNEAKVGESM
jgi:hypothetical protein